MKKFLYCAAVVALATACTQEDDWAINQEASQGQGLTFEVTVPQGAALTKGELYQENGRYPFFWYAEQDRIDVLGYNVTAVNPAYGGGGAANTGKGVVGASAVTSGVWDLTTSPITPASYKATKSQGEGQFTASSDADMLALMDYIATNPNATTITLIATNGIMSSAVTSNLNTQNQVIPGSLKTLELTTTSDNANQTVDRANTVIAPMYSVSSAKKDAAYESVGEKANLEFYRPFPVIRFTTKNTNDYKDYFGKLEKVTLTTKKLNGTAYEAGSKIAYDNSKKYTVIGEKTGWDAGSAYYSGDANTVTVTLTDGTWTDNDAVYMTVAPVTRNKQKEMLVIKYEFENITFTLDGTQKNAEDFEKYETSNDWTAVDANGNPNNAVASLPALDINNYDYLVVGESSDYTLIVNRGTIGDILKEDAGAVKVIWDGQTKDPAVADFKTVIVNCDLTDADYANLNLFTSLTKLKLTKETSLPAGALEAFAASTKSNKILEIPMVTKIDPKFLGEETNLKDVSVLNTESYGYAESAVVNQTMFKGLATYLTKVNIKAVTDMTPIFGQPDAALSFQNYAVLESVTVNNKALVLRANSFSGCVKLKEVVGVVNPTEGYNAFEKAGQTGSSLKKINVSTTEFASSVFLNASGLAEILYNGAQVAPTVVGASAFEGTAIQYMDLSKITSVGRKAFKDITELAGPAKGVAELHVGGDVVPESLFDGCSSLTVVQFDNATSFERYILSRASSIRQIKFAKPFTIKAMETGYWSKGMFGRVDEDLRANVELFISSSQDMSYFEGTTLNLPQVDANGDPIAPISYTFKDLIKQ